MARICGHLAGGILAIQGPPGAGKTSTGARMICELVRQGKTVGVTATRRGHQGGRQTRRGTAVLP
jgi:KaiC/GvpD/RAD55 family RecA-like ATPase